MSNLHLAYLLLYVSILIITEVKMTLDYIQPENAGSIFFINIGIQAYIQFLTVMTPIRLTSTHI